MRLNITMFDKEALYNKACEIYAQTEDTISRMDQVFRDISGLDYDGEATLVEFDLILQGILLSVACADGVFDETERTFIENITVHGDLLEFLCEDLPEDASITWDNLVSLPQEMTDELVAILPHAMEEMCEDFVSPLAAVDFSYARYGHLTTTPGDFLRQIETALLKISSLLAFVDDNGEDEEILSAANMINALVDRHWKKYIES